MVSQMCKDDSPTLFEALIPKKLLKWKTFGALAAGVSCS